MRRFGIGRLALNSIKIIPQKEKREPNIKKINEFSPDAASSAICRSKDFGAFQTDLAIIVPIYQTEKYVRQCLLSLLNQKTDFRYQIILVNDGTHDNSIGEIADLLDNPQVILLEQTNQGLSAARNTGLNAAKAKYVCFVDSDDYVSESMAECWLRKAVETDADIVVGNFKYLHEKTRRFKTNTITEAQKKDRYRLMGTACIKIFKEELFRQIRFQTGYWFEDSVVKHLLFTMAKTVECVDEALYFYRLHDTGITAESKKFRPKCIDSTYITVQLLRDRETLGLVDSPEYKAYFFEQLIMNYRRMEGIEESIRYEIFCWMAKLTEQRFSDFRGDERRYLMLLYRSLISRDFEAYKKICKWA